MMVAMDYGIDRVRGAGPAQPAPTAEPSVGTVTEIAPNWKVIFHNDDVTTFECVIDALSECLGFDEFRASCIARVIHVLGRAVVAILPEVDADARAAALRSFAGARNMPLVANIEPL